MRILQFISSAGFFGAENVVLQLAIALDKLGVDVIVGIVNNVQNPHLELIEECRRVKIKHSCFMCCGKIDYSFVRDLRRFVINEHIDIIHSHGYKSNIYAYLATIGTSVKLVSTCHNWIGNDPKMHFYAKLDRFILRKFAYVIAVSAEVCERLLLSRVNSNNVEKINNGIDTNAFCDAKPPTKLLEEFGTTAENLVIIGTVGRLSKEKGHSVLLKAFREISDEHPKAKLILVGDGPLRKKLAAEFAGPHILFTGNRRDVSELYRLMDIFVLPSLTEGLPMVLLEAMASGKAVISSRVGEIPNVIEDGKTGVLVDPGVEVDLQRALTRLLSSPRLVKEFGNKAQEAIRGKYSAESMGQAYLKVYQNVIQTEIR